jgi:L-lactate utilization protein LutB
MRGSESLLKRRSRDRVRFRCGNSGLNTEIIDGPVSSLKHERKKMDKPIENYWRIRLNDLKEALEENNFEVFIAKDTADAKNIVLEQILPAIGARSVSWGGSMTYLATGIYEAIKGKTGLDILDTYDKSLTPEQSNELRRKSLLVDLFITGTNAVTEDGLLVNLDMIGNRVCALNFGPKHVVLLIGRNKIVNDLDDAMYRVKNYSGPANAMRLDKKTPCVKTSYCEECKSPDRICNVWTITEKSYPKGRIKIVLINQDLGL